MGGNMKEITEKLNLKIIIILLILFIIGFVLILISYNIENLNWKNLLNALGSFFIVASILTIIWEIILKRSLIKEIVELTQMSYELKQAGIEKVTNDFHHGIDWSELFLQSKELDVLVSYAATWRNANQRIIEEFSQKSGTKMRIILPNVDNNVLMSELSNKFNKSVEELKKLIIESKDYYVKLDHDSENINVEIWYFNQSLYYTYYRFTDKIVYASYNNLGRKGPTIMLILHKAGYLYKKLHFEFNEMIKDTDKTIKIH